RSQLKWATPLSAYTPTRSASAAGPPASVRYFAKSSVASSKPCSRCTSVPPLPPTYTSPPDRAALPPPTPATSSTTTSAPAARASIAAQAPAAPKPTPATSVSWSQAGPALSAQGCAGESRLSSCIAVSSFLLSFSAQGVAAGVRLGTASPGPLSTQLVPPSVYIMVTQRLQAVQPERWTCPRCRRSTQPGSWIRVRPRARVSNPSAITRATPSAEVTPPR